MRVTRRARLVWWIFAAVMGWCGKDGARSAAAPRGSDIRATRLSTVWGLASAGELAIARNRSTAILENGGL